MRRIKQLDEHFSVEFFGKHFPKRISDRLPDLFSCMRDEILFDGNTRNVIAFYHDNTLIGACNLSFEVWSMVDGQPAWEIYIERFEVVGKHRGKGNGTKMFNMILSLFNIYRISLSHFSREADGGVSESFWKSLGFNHLKGYGPQYMENNLIKIIK